MATHRTMHSHTTRTELPTKPQTYQGLCATCIYAPECAGARNVEAPVVHCEQFDDRVSVSLEPVGSQFTLRTRTEAQVKPAAEGEPELKGLCVNCDNRKICRIPKPESGVWYCEEYR